MDAATGNLAFAVERAPGQPLARAAQASSRILGDVNNDGRVNISDALIVATYGIDRAITIPNSGDIALGDVNRDGRVNISDALIIASYGIDRSNPSLPTGIGQAVGPAPLPGAFEVSSIAPTTARPGEGITLRGRFTAPGIYWVAFDTLRVPALSQSDSVVTALVPLVRPGALQVAVLDTLGHTSTRVSFLVGSLPAPQHTPAQVAATVETAGEQVAASVPALMQGTGLYSTSAVQQVEAEFARWSGVLPLVPIQIRELPAEQARQVTAILENSGALQVLTDLGGIDVGAPKLTADAFGEHHNLIRADGLSFVLGNSSTLLKGAGVVVLFTGFGAPGAAPLFEVSAWLSHAQDVINAVIPSDLDTLRIAPIGDIPQGQSTTVLFHGDFQTESSWPASTVKMIVRGMFQHFTYGIGAAAPIDQVVDKVLTTLAQAGIGELQRSLSDELAPFVRTAPDVPLDLALYSLDAGALLEMLGLGLPGTSILRNLETKYNLDLHGPAAVTVTPPTRADYAVASSQLTGRTTGSGILSAQASTFKRADGWWGALGLVGWRTVGPEVASFAVKVPANQPPTATISAPPSTSSATRGAVVTFRGSATDPEDGPLTGASLVWSSSRDGRLGTSSVLSTSSLTVGTHTVMLTATDSRGGTGTATVTVSVSDVRRPDLLVDNLTVAPALPTTTTPLTIQVRVANVGQASAAQAWAVLRVDGVGRDSLAQDIGAGLEAWIEFDPLLLGVGAHTVEVVADPNGRLDDVSRANDRTTQSITISPGTLAARSLVFVLDLSGSMNDSTSSRPPMLRLAKAALAQVLATAPATGTQEYALVTFGGTCGAADQVRTPVPFTTAPTTMASLAAGLTADGGTPLAEALRAAQHLALDQASSDDVQLVLLSDGVETCGGNPIAVAQAIAAGRRAKLARATKPLARLIKLNVIGMGVAAGGAEEQQLQQIQQAAGGNYFRVSQPQDLAAALGQASGLQTATATLTGKVTDSQGRALSGASVRLLNHPDLREQTDANGSYSFPASFQGVDSLIVEAVGYLRRATEVYVSGRSYDVQLQPSAALLPVAVATAEPASVTAGETVTLRGGGSSDPAGSALVYHWGQSSANPFPVSLSPNDSETAFAMRVTLADLGTYRFTLVVENRQGLRSAPDTAVVDVRRPPRTVTTPGGTTHVLMPMQSGEYSMGSSSGEADEQPVHTVSLDEYYIDQYEVTNLQYQAFVQATGREPPRYATDSGYSQSRQPVVGVTWYAADAYCRWADLRLPSEAEWEAAARGTDGRTYPWGEGLRPDRANHANLVGKPSTVGSYPLGVSPCGAYDMAGNVWEWVSDWYAYYSSDRESNPTGPLDGNDRVMRGGAWGNYGGHELRCADRGAGYPSGWSPYQGFRCARDWSVPPVANAGPDQDVEVGATVRLDASGSRGHGEDPLTYEWTASTGAALAAATTPTPTFAATVIGVYRFVLVVRDAEGTSASDTTRVTVHAPPRTVLTPAGTTHQVVLVPAGEFTMGANDGSPWEAPMHTVYLDEYSIDQYEVTNAQYLAFVEATGRYRRPADGDFNQPEQPVVQVTWFDATAYCQWAGLRLPTEAEWEKAARGTDGRNYPWGDAYDTTRANWSYANGLRRVGSYPSGGSPYGAYDMAGNAWEWVADWDGPYPSGKVSNPAGPAGPVYGEKRVLRGGSYMGGSLMTDRDATSPNGWYSYYQIGFRCVQD
ncbi:MAG: SUMF1/EgtB/PvdO family nonheme iron enzyme [Candidatus Latescibacterota bacterium]